MKSLFCVLLIFIFNLTILGQDQKSTYEVRITTFDTFNTARFYFSEVIDNRTDKTSIGERYQDMSNTKIPVVVPEELSFHLLKAFNSLLRSGELKRKLIARINNFEMTDYPNSIMQRYDIDIDFLERRDSTLTQVFHSEIISYSDGKSHKSTIETGFIDLLKAVVFDFQKNGSDYEPRIAESTIKQKINTYLSVDSFTKDGFYASFEDLVAQKKIGFGDFKVDYNTVYGLGNTPFKKYLAYHPNGNRIKSKEKPKGIFAMVYEGELYMNSRYFHKGNYFVKALTYGNLIYFQDFISDDKSRMTVLGGAVGGAVGGVAMSALAPESTRAFILDTSNGEIRFLDRVTLSELAKPYFDLQMKIGKTKSDFKISNEWWPIINYRKQNESSVSDIEIKDLSLNIDLDAAPEQIIDLEDKSSYSYEKNSWSFGVTSYQATRKLYNKEYLSIPLKSVKVIVYVQSIDLDRISNFKELQLTFSSKEEVHEAFQKIIAQLKPNNPIIPVPGFENQYFYLSASSEFPELSIRYCPNIMEGRYEIYIGIMEFL